MPTPIYYPPLTGLVPVDALPDELGFAKDGLSNLLDDLYFRDLQHSESRQGDAAQYKLKIVAEKELAVEIPGTGIELILNPSDDPSARFTEFPVSLRYEWGILAYLSRFDVSTFSFQPADFYQLALSILGLTEAQLLQRTLSVFLGDPNAFDTFIDDVNAFYGTSLPHPTTSHPLDEVITALNDEFGKDASLIIFAVYILDQADLDATKRRLDELLGSFFGGSLQDHLLDLITPKIDATLGIGAALRFPRKVLVPLDESTGDPLPEPAQSLLSFDAGDFYFSTGRGVGYDDELTAELTRSQIGQTGFEIDIDRARLDISRSTNLPEAKGRPDEFVGVYIEEASITLPPLFNQDESGSNAVLKGRQLLVGTGGLSGTIGLEAENPTDPNPALIKGSFGGGFELGLSAVSLSFMQNAVTGSDIRGFMKIPGFEDTEGNDAEVQIRVDIGADGNFSVTASEEQGIEALRIPDVLDVEIKSLAVGVQDNRFFVSVTGALDFMDQGGAIGDFIPEKIEIEKLIIWEDGQVELQGGSIVLPEPVSLSVGPAELSITAIHFGSHEQEHDGIQRQYAYFGFDGGVSVDPGGVDARGDGIKFYFTRDVGPGMPLHVFLRIQSIKLDLIIPGSAEPENAALLVSGYLSMKDGAGDGTEYIGGVDFSLPKAKLAGSAAMRYNPKAPAFLIDAGLELAAPIVLGATGLGIYGFRGLVGMRYVASKTEAGLADDAKWWQYYKAKIPPDHKEGIQVSKFSEQEGFSVGAGVSLATAPDAGRAFSSKIFLLLSLPEVVLLQGQGQMLKKRIGLDTTEDPPFFAMIAFSSSSVEAAFGVDYKIPDDGKIADITGVTEMAYYWNDAGAWYINVGKDQPEERRVSAKLLTIWEAYFYLMLSSEGIRTGAGVSYDLSKSIGPFKVELGAYLDVAGEISFEPLQVGGAVQLGGYLGLKIFGFGFRIEAEAGLAAEAPRPFTVTGRLKACVKVLWKRRCVTLKLKWTFDDQLNTDEVPVLGEDLSRSAQAVNIHTKETYPVFAERRDSPPSVSDLDDHIVPMDSYLDIEFKQAMNPGKLARFARAGGSAEYNTMVPPQKGKSPQVKHLFHVESISIESWNPEASQWEAYDIYDAATPLQLADFVTTDLAEQPYGYWQKQHPTKHNKLRVLAQTPFDYFRQGFDPPPPEDLGVDEEDVFCAPERRSMICLEFDRSVGMISSATYHALEEVLYTVTPDDAVVASASGDIDAELCIEHGSTASFYFPEPTAHAELRLETEAEAVEVTWIGRQRRMHNGTAVYEWVELRHDVVPTGALSGPVMYDDLQAPVHRVDVRGVRCGGEEWSYSEREKTLGYLGRFLDQLASRRDLTLDAVMLYPERDRPSGCAGVVLAILGVDGRTKKLSDHTYYQPFFTQLYHLEGAEWVRYGVEETAETHLYAAVRDSEGYECEIALYPVDGEAINWSRVDSIRDLRMDRERAVEGTNVYFLGTAVMDDGALREIGGRSCHVVGSATRSDAALPVHCTRTPKADALLKFLNVLVNQEHLTAETDLASHSAYQGTFFGSPLYPGPGERVLYESAVIASRALAAVAVGARLYARIRDFAGYECLLVLNAVDRGDVFDRIEQFEKIEVVSSQTPGPQYDFRVLAVLADGTRVWLEGRSCYPVGTCREGCRTCVGRICYATVEDAAYNDGLPSDQDVQDDADAMVEGLSGSIQPIWRPHTYYAVTVETLDEAFSTDGNTSLAAYTNTYVFGFRTVGPIGHYHRYLDNGSTQTHPDYQALLSDGREDEFKLATLGHYIDYPKCYPNADGRLTNAKPLYYVDPRLDLFYVQPYVYEMYRDWDVYSGAEAVASKLDVLIKDPDGSDALADGSWASTPLVIVQPDVRVVASWLKDGDVCVDVEPAPPFGVQTVFDVPALDPLKAYTAIFRNVLEVSGNESMREVHRYVFQTSRYADFAEHIGSWVLAEDSGTVVEGAVYDVELDRPVAAFESDAQAVLADPASSRAELKEQFANPFDRLMDGILRIGALQAAGTLEFNVVWAGGRRIGVLVRSPEPLNDPKMPDLGTTVMLSIDGGTAMEGLHAKDAASVFISNDALDLPAGTYTFTFHYKRFDGSDYATQASETVSFDVA